jgi:hypothetical protein
LICMLRLERLVRIETRQEWHIEVRHPHHANNCHAEWILTIPNRISFRHCIVAFCKANRHQNRHRANLEFSIIVAILANYIIMNRMQDGSGL